MAAEWQTPPGADVILRTSGGKEFLAHKLILSLASSVFEDMFSLPQPTPIESSQLPIVDVNDPPEALEMFLQIVYPTPNPPINDIEALVSVLRLADKYNAGVVLDAHKDFLQSTGLDSPPVHVYAILCICGRKKESEAAARRVPFASLASLTSHPLLRLMTVEHYHRLVVFMVTRDKRMWEILNKRQAEAEMDILQLCRDVAHQQYSGTLVASLQVAFQANPWVRPAEALGIVSSAPLPSSPCKNGCVHVEPWLREYAELVLNELVEMAEGLPWEQ